MKVRDTKHGLRLLRDGRESIDVTIITDDERFGTWLLIGTRHDAIEVRITPAGRKVIASETRLRPSTFSEDA